MKIRQVIRDLILQQLSEHKFIKQLAQTHKTTYPKVHTSKIFKHSPPEEMATLSIIRKEADHYFNNDAYLKLPVENIPVDKIVPTQRFVTIGNLEKVKHGGINTGAYLVEANGLYYILDGHHRVANQIIQGANIVKAHVYHQVD